MFLPVNNVVRKPCIRLARWKMLEWIMLCVILANCVTLCMDSNAPGFQETVLYARLSGLNYFFIAAFSIEMTIKIIALGFVLGQHTYLRNGWNVLDFTVVCFGWLELVPGFGNYTIIRVARILRPLRLVTKIEALKILVSCIIRSLPMLGDVAVLSLFFYAISGIASVEILKGKMLYRCASPDNTTFTLTDSDGVYQVRCIASAFIGFSAPHLPSPPSQNVAYIVPQSDYTQNTWPCVGPMADRVTWRNISGVPTPSLSSPGGPSSPSTVGRYCDSSQGSGNVFGQTYTYGLFCVPYQNPTPYGSYRHYDNILTAWLATFQHMAPQDWSFIMYDEWDGLIWWTWPYDILMVIIGAFLIQNLALAILFLNFTKNYAEQSRKAREIAESIRILSRRGSVASQTSSYHSSDYDYDPSSDRGHVQQHGGPYLSMMGGVWSRFMRAISALFSPLSEPWESFRDLCYELQDTKGFHIAATAMIILNAIVLAFVWYPNYPDSVNVAVINLNYAFTMFFLFEMVVKVSPNPDSLSS